MLAIDIDENVNRDRNFDYEIKRQKAIKQELGCKFIGIDYDKEESDSFRTTNKIFRHIKQSIKNTLLNNISTRLLKLKFKSDNIIESKAI